MMFSPSQADATSSPSLTLRLVAISRVLFRGVSFFIVSQRIFRSPVRSAAVRSALASIVVCIVRVEVHHRHYCGTFIGYGAPSSAPSSGMVLLQGHLNHVLLNCLKSFIECLVESDTSLPGIEIGRAHV